jgi:hypothetical protein
MAAQEVEAFQAFRQFHASRLLRVQLQPQPGQHVLDAALAFRAALRRAAHHHEVVRIPHQFAQVSAMLGPHPVQHVQVDVRQQR